MQKRFAIKSREHSFQSLSCYPDESFKNFLIINYLKFYLDAKINNKQKTHKQTNKQNARLEFH